MNIFDLVSVECFILFFQIVSAIILLRLSGAIGSLSLNFGYASMSRAYVSGDIGFNLFFRALYTPIAISLLSITLYIIGFDFLVKNIWLIAVWYFLIQIILSFKKLQLTRLDLFFGSGMFAILLSYIFYEHGIRYGLSALIPASGDITTELWLLVIVFFYGILNNNEVARSYQDIDKKFEEKYLHLKSEYSDVITEDFHKIKILNDVLFAIMIFEDFNRPKIFRFIERLVFPLGIVSSTGIMQLKDDKKLTDTESVAKAQQLILDSYEKHKTLPDHALVGKILTDYNRDAYYREEVRNVYQTISAISFRLEEDKFGLHKLNGEHDDFTEIELYALISKLKDQISTLENGLEAGE